MTPGTWVNYDVGSWTITTNTATTTDNYSWTSSGSDTGTSINIISDMKISEIAWHTYVKAQNRIRRSQGKRIPLPDDAVVRRPAPREFNRYINGSDLLQEFIAFLGRHQVRKAEALQIPLELFIKWLIIEAAKADNEEPPIQLKLPAPKARCLQCSRILKRRTSLLLCSHACVMRRLRAA